jgi:Uma2 family endonuclease
VSDTELSRRELTVAEVADFPENYRYDLIHGKLIWSELTFPVHNIIASQVATALSVNCPGELAAVPGISILIDYRTETCTDVAVIDMACGDVSPVPARYVSLVAEVLSDSSRTLDRRDKMQVYAYAGIPAYWIIDSMADPVTFTQYLLDPDGVYVQRLHTDEAVTLDAPWEVAVDPTSWARFR